LLEVGVEMALADMPHATEFMVEFLVEFIRMPRARHQEA
jgi:hypothetical protein